jgi:predicted DNA-binding transcriptional regulator AlpA
MTHTRDAVPVNPAALAVGAPGIVAAPPALCVDRLGLARMLGISLRQVYRLDDAGKLPPALVLGTCKRWSIEEVEAWVRAGAPPRRVWQNLRSAVAAPPTGEA